MGVGMVLCKILDQYLSSYQTWTKSIKGFGNNEVLKTLTFVDADTNANANANADAGDSTIVLRELCSGELKTSISLWIFCLFEILKIAVCFLWLSLPGHYRVIDEALLAETT